MLHSPDYCYSEEIHSEGLPQHKPPRIKPHLLPKLRILLRKWDVYLARWLRGLATSWTCKWVLGAQPEGYEGQQYGKFTTRNKSSCMKGGVSSVSFNQRPSIQVQHAFCLGEEKGRSCSVYRSRVRVTCCTYRRGRPQVPVDVKPPRTPCDCLMYRPGVTDSTSCDYENSPSGK